MNIITETKKYNKIPPIVIFMLLFFYAIVDLQTSSVTGNIDANRSNVYLVLIAIIAFTSLYVIIISLFNKKIYLTEMTVALGALTSWIILIDIYQEVELWSMLVQLGLSVLWIFASSFFALYMQRNPKGASFIEKCICSMLILYAAATIYYFADLYYLRGQIPVMNLAYNVIVLIPWLCLLNNKKIEIMGYFITCIIVLISMKRGALIVFPIMIFFNMFMKGIIEKRGGKYLLKLVAFLVFFCSALFVVDSISNGFISSRFSSEELASGSGRDWLYSTAINSISNRGIIDFILGFGSGSSVSYLGTGVHNEWLEFLFSFGLVGVFLYANLYGSIITRCIKIKRKAPMYLPACTMMLTYMLIVGLFGGIYFIHSTFYAFSFFGFVEGLANNKINQVAQTKG